MDRTQQIAIVGGGIGGMALALSLHDAGFTAVDVYESASTTRELGVGINVLPHAVRELDELGLADELEAIGIATQELAFYSIHGQRIWSEPRGRAAGFRWPQLSIHRGRLLGTLVRAVVDRLGGDRVHYGHHLTRVDNSGSRARASFTDRSSGEPVADIEADVLVGCDGVHSAVRAALRPDEGPPQWNGITMWRGVTESDSMLVEPTMIMAGHFAHRIVAYPISAEHRARGRGLVNWVAEWRGEQARPMPPQDWDHVVDIDEVLELFAAFAFEVCDVPHLIRNAAAVYQYPMVDRDPIERWSDGRVTLLGDAAHPMYPVGSNGASQAIIDARVLAQQLALAPDADSGISRYEEERRPATSAVVLANRRVGPERCMEIVHERAPHGFDRIEDVISTSELEEIAARYRATAGFAVDELNTRPSLSVPG